MTEIAFNPWLLKNRPTLFGIYIFDRFKKNSEFSFVAIELLVASGASALIWRHYNFGNFADWKIGGLVGSATAVFVAMISVRPINLMTYWMIRKGLTPISVQLFFSVIWAVLSVFLILVSLEIKTCTLGGSCTGQGIVIQRGTTLIALTGFFLATFSYIREKHRQAMH